jgi:hypothetical protein
MLTELKISKAVKVRYDEFIKPKLSDDMAKQIDELAEFIKEKIDIRKK